MKQFLASVVTMAFLGLSPMQALAHHDKVVKHGAEEVVKELVKQTAKHAKSVVENPAAQASAAGKLAASSHGTFGAVIVGLAIAAPFLALFAYDVYESYPIYKRTGVWPSIPNGMDWDTCAIASYGHPDPRCE